MLTISTCAKINLTLEVLGRRPDGYHEIASVLQAIDLRDFISFQLDEGVYLTCNAPDLASPQNLVVKAGELLRKETGCTKGARIHLDKRIPVSAGLGGGSGDAAAALWGLSQLWGLKISPEQLLQMAAKLGTDVPFFLGGGTALGEGRGDRITPLPSLHPSWVVLAKPPVSIPPKKTERLYATLDSSHFTRGESSGKLVDCLRGEGEVPSHLFFNVFEKVAFGIFAGLEEYRLRFLEAGAESVHLAGTGPILFTLVGERSRGETIQRRLRREGLETYLVKTAKNPLGLVRGE